jgi:hypothetical protein
MTNETSRDDIKVGYKRPPRHSRFQPGRSGNPRGKQKGVRNLGSDVKRTLEVPVRFNEHGKERRISTQEAALLRLREKALKGDARSLDGLLALAKIFNNSSAVESLRDEHVHNIADRLNAALARVAESDPGAQRRDGKVRPHRHPPRSGDAGKTARKSKLEMNSNIKTCRVSSSGPSAAPGPTVQEFAELRRQLAALTGKYNELKQATGCVPRECVRVRDDDLGLIRQFSSPFSE